MTRMVQKWLERVRELDVLIDSKLVERSQLLELATRMGAEMDGMPHAKGNVSDPVGNNVAKLVTLAKEIDALVDQFVDHKQKVIEALERLPENEYKVLHRQYIRYMTPSQIASDMNYSTMQIWRFQQNGLKLLKDVIGCYNML